ncbi:MAG: filamentous hemagglutinin N-terminal domain-containing protein [Cyanobacteria bacterium P01_G01_bin.19]
MLINRIFPIGSFLSFFVAVAPVRGQIIPDSTTDSFVRNDCQNSCQITGGTVAGQNLFHSFQEFNINAGENVYFADPGVNDIFGRVSGSNPSQIFGTLGVSGGDANLWLLNPNGIIFGEGATLDVSGSFLATTADEIKFGDRNSFAAVAGDHENLALLTVKPDALFFNQMAQNHPITLDTGASLRVEEQQNIVLLGAQSNIEEGINLTNAEVIAPGGSISLGAVEDRGTIGIDSDFQLSFADGVIKGDIALGQNSKLDVSSLGAGAINLEGKNITLTEESQIVAHTLGDFDGKSINIQADNLTIAENGSILTSTVGTGDSSDIDIVAQEAVTLVGRDSSVFQEYVRVILFGGDRSNNLSSSIFTFSAGDGKAGNITIRSQNTTIQNGAWILASARNQGDTGNIDIQAGDRIALDGSGIITGSASNSQGYGGLLSLNSNSMVIQNGGILASGTLGQGSGGDIEIDVADSLKLYNSSFSSLNTVPTGIYTNTVGDSGAAGNLTLNVGSLAVREGSQISSGSGVLTNQTLIPIGGKGGNITINATDQIEIAGVSNDNSFPSGIVNTTFSANSAGSIEINTRNLDLRGEAVISASSLGMGDSGNLTIDARESIHLRGNSFQDLQDLFVKGLSGEAELSSIRGGLLTNTTIGQPGETKITTPSLILENGALISTSTFGMGDGGNIHILAEDVRVSSSLIASSTVSQGHAGNIAINTHRLVTANSGLITTSSTGMGNAGDLRVNAKDSIKLIDVGNTSFVSGGLVTNSLGLSYSGNLAVSTKELTIDGGAKISASNGSNFELVENQDDFNLTNPAFQLDSPRNVTIDADSINISGTSQHELFNSGISSVTTSIFPASNIEIHTSKLAIADQGAIEVSSYGEGNAGNLKISANSASLQDQGHLNATTLSGRGGNIELDINGLLSLDSSSGIKTDALNFGDGGNIDIDTAFLIALNGSSISAQALSGQGGNIEVTATDLLISNDSQITASSKVGIDGEVNIKTFNSSNHNSLFRLPEKTIQGENIVVESCSSRNRPGKFAYVGKGGLPANPLTEYSITNRTLMPDFALDNERLASSQPLNLEQAELSSAERHLLEATEWKVNRRGNVELLTEPELNFSVQTSMSSACPF